MRDMIYRNGKLTRDATSIILLKNSAALLIPTAMGFALNWALYRKFEYSDFYVNLAILAVFTLVGLLAYLYRTIASIKPLAFKQGDLLTINIGLFRKKTIELSAVKKITCQFKTEHDQIMRVFYPGKAFEEFMIVQTNCSTEDLGRFITENHAIEVRYS